MSVESFNFNNMEPIKPIESLTKESAEEEFEVIKKAYDKGYKDGKKGIDAMSSPYLAGLTTEKQGDRSYRDHETSYFKGYNEGKKIYFEEYDARMKNKKEK